MGGWGGWMAMHGWPFFGDRSFFCLSGRVFVTAGMLHFVKRRLGKRVSLLNFFQALWGES